MSLSEDLIARIDKQLEVLGSISEKLETTNLLLVSLFKYIKNKDSEIKNVYLPPITSTPQIFGTPANQSISQPQSIGATSHQLVTSVDSFTKEDPKINRTLFADVPQIINTPPKPQAAQQSNINLTPQQKAMLEKAREVAKQKKESGSKHSRISGITNPEWLGPDAKDM